MRYKKYSTIIVESTLPICAIYTYLPYYGVSIPGIRRMVLIFIIDFNITCRVFRWENSSLLNFKFQNVSLKVYNHIMHVYLYE